MPADAERDLVMQPRLALLRRAYENEVLVAVSNQHVRNDLPVLRRDLGRRTIDEKMLRRDDVEDRPRLIANQPAAEKRLQVDSAHDHHLLVLHRSASSTSSCKAPFDERPLPRSARGCPSSAVKRPPASSTMI